MDLNVTWSRRWRLHETASPRRRRCDRQRVYASREGVTVSFPRRSRALRAPMGQLGRVDALAAATAASLRHGGQEERPGGDL